MITSKSPINKTALSHENNLVFQRLMRGHKVNKFKLPIGTCHSRMSDVREYLLKRKVILQDCYIYVGDVRCKEYWLLKEDIEALKKGVEVVKKSWVNVNDLIEIGFRLINKDYFYDIKENRLPTMIGYNTTQDYFSLSMLSCLKSRSDHRLIYLNLSSLKELKSFIKAVKQK